MGQHLRTQSLYAVDFTVISYVLFEAGDYTLTYLYWNHFHSLWTLHLWWAASSLLLK
jgi:hypothetical protein